jgi:hypothetical protein
MKLFTKKIILLNTTKDGSTMADRRTMVLGNYVITITVGFLLLAEMKPVNQIYFPAFIIQTSIRLNGIS